MGFLEKAKKSQWYGVGLLLVITVLCWAVFKVLCPDTFGAPDQLLTYLQTGIIYAVGGCGLYFIVVMGLWDFSIGSVLVLACLLSIGFAQMFGYPGLIIAPIVAGALMGVANGAAYIKLRIPSLSSRRPLAHSTRASRCSPPTGPAPVFRMPTRCSAPILGISSWPSPRSASAPSSSSTRSSARRQRDRRQRAHRQEHGRERRQVQVLRVRPVLHVRRHHGHPVHRRRHRPDPVTACVQSLNFKPLMGPSSPWRSASTGHPVVSVVIGEFIIAMMFAGFVALDSRHGEQHHHGRHAAHHRLHHHQAHQGRRRQVREGYTMGNKLLAARREDRQRRPHARRQGGVPRFLRGRDPRADRRDGFGKSTFTNMLTGILPIGSGTFTLSGEQVVPRTRSTPTTTASPSSFRRRAPCPASPSPRTCSWAMRTSSSRTASRTPAP